MSQSRPHVQVIIQRTKNGPMLVHEVIVGGMRIAFTDAEISFTAKDPIPRLRVGLFPQDIVFTEAPQ